MPIDPSILSTSRQPTGMSTGDFVSAIGQIQQDRQQMELRRIAAEEARAKAAEAAAARQRANQVEQSLQSAMTLDPATGQPTVDWQKLLADKVPAGAMFQVMDTINESATKIANLKTARLTAEEKTILFRGAAAAPVAAGQYSKPLWDIAVHSAFKAGAISAAERDQGLAMTDPAEIQRATDTVLQQAEAIETRGKAPAQTGFTLSPGEVRYDASGKQIATGGEKPAEHSTAYKEWQDYRSTGGALDFNAYQTADANRRAPRITVGGSEPLVQAVGPDGKVVWMTRGQAVGKTPGSATDAGGIKLSAATQEDIATMMTVQELATEVGTLGPKTKWAGVGPVQGRIGATMIGSGGAEGETLRNMIGNIQGTIAKLRGGTSFTPTEQALLETYTPTITDTETKITAKLKSLASFIEKKRTNTLRVARGEYTVPGAADTSGKPKADPLGIR